MAMLKEVVSSPLLSHPEEGDVHGKVVFFDVMGLMMVVYSEKVGIAVNLLNTAAVLLTIYLGTAPNSSKKLSGIFLQVINCLLSPPLTYMYMYLVRLLHRKVVQSYMYFQTVTIHVTQ